MGFHWQDTGSGEIGLTALPDDPFYDALQQGLIDNVPDIVGLAGRAFLIDNASGQWKRRSVKVVEQRNVSSQRDLTLLPQNVWRQSVESWHKGSGQSNMDRVSADQDRFYRSININPFKKWEISLLNQTELVKDYKHDPSSKMMLQEVNGALFGACGLTVLLITDYDTWDTSELTLSSPASSITTDGEYFIVANGDIISRFKNDNGTLTKVDDITPTGTGESTFVLYTQDRLITNRGNVLWDVTPGGSPAQIYEHPIPEFRWVSGTNAPNGTYLIGGVGDKWFVYFMQLDSTGAQFDAPVVAQSLPEGEIGYSVFSYQGFILVGTRFGLRMMVGDSDGLLTSGATIPTNSPVYDFEGQNRFVWYTQTNITDVYESPVNEETVADFFPSAPVQGLGRLDLSEYTDVALTPAYANDLIAKDEEVFWPSFGGATPDDPEYQITSVTTVEGTTVGAAAISGRRVFGMAGGRIYVEKLDHPAAGWLEQGRVSYSVEDNKAGLYQIVKWSEANDGGLFLDYKVDGKDWFRANRIDMDMGVSSGHKTTDGLVFSRLEPRYVLIPGDSEFNPAITRWELRSIPAVGRASAWDVPIMNYQELDVNGVKVVRDPTQELQYLMNLVQSGSLFYYQESGLVYSVHATGFEWSPESLATGGLGWQGTYVLTIEEII